MPRAEPSLAPHLPTFTNTMGLCNSYKRLKIQLLPDPADNSSLDNYSGFPHSTTHELLFSAQSCHFCGLIKEPFLRVGHYHISEAVVEEKLRLKDSSHVLLRAGRRENGEPSADRRVCGGARLDSIEMLVDYGQNFMKGRIHLYAPKG